jgi:hypothetical protein
MTGRSATSGSAIRSPAPAGLAYQAMEEMWAAWDEICQRRP